MKTLGRSLEKKELKSIKGGNRATSYCVVVTKPCRSAGECLGDCICSSNICQGHF